MKTFALVLLMALLCAERAQGLRCYHCTQLVPGDSCPVVTCTYPNGVCVTQKVTAIVESQEVKVENKLCLPTCPPEDSVIPQLVPNFTMSYKISCCKEDLCNAGVLVVGSTCALSVGVLLSLGSVLWALL
ncbi:lymphocyte antigen 6S [Microcebus murinus]|uniref:lymphocyte antigen 6S n=1 Tax=Microcebus murinus TaxID=30608 RepID=UPI000643D4D1|nr:lymphocyte antigen 6A-2/6E-1-like [Microcebus murinus]XP_012608395.1 lymphocyte antigen 6A-2/6E-1-like [Microcebus murinus]